MNWLLPLDIGVIIGLILAPAVLALALAFRLFNFPDLTMEGALPLGAAVFAVTLKGGAPLLISITAAFVAGGLAGASTAFIHQRFHLNKFLAGIIVVAITYSLTLRIMRGSNIGLLQLSSLFDFVEPLDGSFEGRFHLGTIIFLASTIGIGVILIVSGLMSRWGIRLRVVGSNPEYAKSLGINVWRNMTIGLALTNGLAALSGVLLASHQGFADIGMGQGVLILALAAFTIGERLLPNRTLAVPLFVVVAAVLGSVLYQIIVAYAVRLGLAPTDLKLATAVLVLLVVSLRVTRSGELLTEDPR